MGGDVSAMSSAPSIGVEDDGETFDAADEHDPAPDWDKVAVLQDRYDKIAALPAAADRVAAARVLHAELAEDSS